MSEKEITNFIRRQYYKNLDDPVNFTVHGMRRKVTPRPELAHLKSDSAEYHTAHTRLRRAEIKAQKEIW